MKKLLTEIVTEITSYLPLKDKLSFACCESELYKVISENTLYNKLVFGKESKLNQALELLGRSNLGIKYVS